MKHKHPTSQKCRAIPAFTAALFAAGFLTNSHAQVQSAGTLFVNVDATAAAEGPLTSIPNAGTLGGVFAATGPAGEAPVVATVGGTKGVQMDGNDFLQLMTAATGGTPITAPAELTGLNPTRSIEVWALNPALATEETMVAWGRRGGGPDGSNVSFNYGSDFRWGAMGHWGNQDLGWNNNGGGPAPQRWHHLVYTYDGDTTRVYADGVFQNGEYVGLDRMNTHPDTPILIGGQNELNPDIGDGVTTRVTSGLRFTGTIAKVRIHDGVLTDAQIAANYNAEKAAFIDPVVPPPPVVVSAPLTTTPVHRYSFNETAGDATDQPFNDSVQTAHGTVLGFGAIFTGTRLVLPGGASSEAAYGDLPNGLLSSNAVVNGGTGKFSIETWYKNTGAQNWGRIFDFGSAGPAPNTGLPGEEILGPGGSGEGRDYLMYSTSIGTDVNNRRLELRNTDPIDEGIVTVDNPTPTHNQDAHIVVTWDEPTGRLTTYENGRQVATVVTDDTMDDINDVNVWLGRSNWVPDANAQGEYDEVRLYNHLLSPEEVLGNTFAGPDKYSTEATAVTISDQPDAVTVNEGGNATFNVGLTGSSPISIQWYSNNVAIPNAISPRLVLNGLTAAANNAEITVRATNVVNGTPVPVTSSIATLTVSSPPPPPAPTIRHKYSFNETEGTVVTDSVGAANGTLLYGGSFGGGQLTLEGGPSGETGPYVDLPNGIISGLGQDGTIEMWFTHRDTAVWTRVFDFGVSTAGEDFQSAGQDFLFWVARTGDGFPRFEANFPNSDALTVLIPNPPGWVPGEEETHVVISYSNSRNAAQLFLNGVLVATTTAPRPLSDMATFDVNNWLGKAQWPDPYWAGSYNELRLYSGSMSADRVAASFAAGPNGTTPVEGPTISITRTATAMTLSWPAAATGYNLETSTSLAAGSTWSPVAGATQVGENMQVTVQTTDTMRFYRLKR